MPAEAAESQRLVMVSSGAGINCRTFVFKNEGHTLGNVLRSVIMQNPQVAFCGYSLPHPAEDQMHLRIQTVEGKVIYQWVLTTVWVRLSKLLGLLLTNCFSNIFFFIST